jgi:hypothetical protein
MVFVMRKYCVSSEVRTEFIIIIQRIFMVLRVKLIFNGTFFGIPGTFFFLNEML